MRNFYFIYINVGVLVYVASNGERTNEYSCSLYNGYGEIIYMDAN